MTEYIIDECKIALSRYKEHCTSKSEIGIIETCINLLSSKNDIDLATDILTFVYYSESKALEGLLSILKFYEENRGVEK